MRSNKRKVTTLRGIYQLQFSYHSFLECINLAAAPCRKSNLLN